MPSIDRIHPETAYANAAPVGRYEITSAQYPLNKENDHFVRFFINIDDESRLVRENLVQVIGDADRTDQNRASRRNTSETRVNWLAGGMGAVAGGGAAGSVIRAGQNKDALIHKLKGWKGGYGAFSAIATAAAGKPQANGKTPFSQVVARGIGAAAGAGIGYLAANALNVTKQLKRLGATITLYTPGSIRADYSLNWEETTSDIADLLSKDRGDELFENLISFKANKDGLPTKVTKILATNASKDIQLITRTTKNPKKDFLFRDVQQRAFVFSYTFAPRTPLEAKEVAKIIYMFKLFAHPELLEGYDNFLYIYPAEFDIVYGFKNPNRDPEAPWDGDESNHNLNRISSCVLTNIAIDYAPNGSYQSLRNGEPLMVTMTLSFRELEALHQGRIEAGY